MKTYYLIVLSVFFTSCESLEMLPFSQLKSSILPDNQAVTTYESKMNQSFGKDELQKFDIHLPKNQSQKVPVIVLFHGGGWREGDKSFIKPFVECFKKRKINCAIVNANYRLTAFKNVTYKEQLEDVGLLLEKLESESENWQIKPQYFLLGYSAGGHLAMLYSYTANSKKVKVTGGIATPTDLTRLRLDESEIGDDVTKFVGKPIETSFDEYLKVSPAYQLNRSSTPTIVFFGGSDKIVPIEQGLFFEQKLKEKKVRYECYIYPNQTHDWSVLDESLDKMLTFADKFM
jgi:acetyl esterase/lipase